MSPSNLLPRSGFSTTIIWKVKKQNWESKQVKWIYTKRGGRGIRDGEKAGSGKEEERESKVQKGMNSGGRSLGSMEHLR